MSIIYFREYKNFHKFTKKNGSRKNLLSVQLAAEREHPAAEHIRSKSGHLRYTHKWIDGINLWSES
jgi:hypothetical protein